MSVARVGKFLARLWARSEGSAMAEFALIIMPLLALSFAVVDFTLLAWDYHRGGEAARRGARLATILPPVADVSGLTAAGDVITCTGTGGGLDCGPDPVVAPDSFTTITNAMQAILPDVESENVQIEYRFSGIGDAALPNGVFPFVTVRIINADYRFMMLNAVPGVPDTISLPSFEVTNLSGAGTAP